MIRWIVVICLCLECCKCRSVRGLLFKLYEAGVHNYSITILHVRNLEALNGRSMGKDPAWSTREVKYPWKVNQLLFADDCSCGRLSTKTP